MMANTTLRIPYAAKIPNVIAAMHAQISIARFNRSVIQSALVNWSAVGNAERHHFARPNIHSDAIVAENAAALTLISVYQ
jgi:hypothetical protein